MAGPSLNRRLSATDATFLYAERKNAPMHIGSISILEGEVTYDEFIQDVTPRLPNLPRFLQIVVPTPFNISHPTWEFDPNFDVHNHIFLHQAKSPGGEEELREVLTRVYTGCLDRSKPLWELHLIIGLEGGRCAIACKVHHAMVDGVGGNEILEQLLDISPGIKRPAPPELEKPAIGGRSARLMDGVFDNAVTQIDAVSELVKSRVERARSFSADQAKIGLAAMSKFIPDIAIPPKALPFNKDGSGERTIVWTEISFAEARAIRRSLECSVNDIMLAMLAGAMGRYADAHGQKLKGRTMRIMMPVNTRPEGKGADLGNRISILPVRLPLDIKDPIERVNHIHDTTMLIKGSNIVGDMGMFGSVYSAFQPVPVQANIGGVLGVLPDSIVVFNTLCTNVPGPQIPLYMVGQKVESMIPFAPIAYNIGVGCAILSYNQKLNVALTADLQSCQDVDIIKEFIIESFDELREAAGVAKIEEVVIKPRKRTRKKKTEAAAEEAGNTKASATNGSSVKTKEPVATRTPVQAKAG